MNEQKFLSEKALAPIIDVKVSTLRAWRLRDYGPPFKKLGSAVRYPLDGLQDWLNDQPQGGGKPKAPQAAALEKEVA